MASNNLTIEDQQNAVQKTIREILQMGFSANDAQQGKKDGHNALFFHNNGDTTKNQGHDQWLYVVGSLKQAESISKAFNTFPKSPNKPIKDLMGVSFSDGNDRIDIKSIKDDSYMVKRLEDHPFLKDKKSLRDERWNAEDLHAVLAAGMLKPVQTFTYTSKQLPFELNEMDLRNKGLVDIQRTDNGSILTFDRQVTRAGLKLDSLSPTPETDSMIQKGKINEIQSSINPIIEKIKAESQTLSSDIKTAQQTIVTPVDVPQQQNHNQAADIQQQIADFKEATGIQLEVRNNKPYHEGNLNLDNSNVQQLPDNLTVEGNLWLENTPIKELPNNLTVNGSLDLRDTPVKELPKNLEVGGWLDISNTSIKELPDNIKVNGDLWLQNTNIERLPDNLTVNGNLWLHNTPIKELPDNLTVKEELNLINTPIQELPADLKVKEAIVMNDRTIKATPEIMTPDGYIDLVKGDAPIQQTSQTTAQKASQQATVEPSQNDQIASQKTDVTPVAVSQQQNEQATQQTQTNRPEQQSSQSQNPNDSKNEISPLIKQFNELKAKHPDALLLFRVGDFYETYQQDARKASQILGITLTKNYNRKDSDGKPIEIAGFPYHALHSYLPKLIRAGNRVAICDQLEDPKLTKTLRQKNDQNDIQSGAVSQQQNNQATHQQTSEQQSPTTKQSQAEQPVASVIPLTPTNIKEQQTQSAQPTSSVDNKAQQSQAGQHTQAAVPSVAVSQQQNIQTAQQSQAAEQPKTPVNNTKVPTDSQNIDGTKIQAVPNDKKTEQIKTDDSVKFETKRIRPLSNIHTAAKKDNPDNIVFIRLRNPNTKRFMYQTYGKEAEFVAKNLDPDAKIISAKVKGKSYSTVAFQQENLATLKKNMMDLGLKPLIINAKGDIVENDNFLNLSKGKQNTLNSQTTVTPVDVPQQQNNQTSQQSQTARQPNTPVNNTKVPTDSKNLDSPKNIAEIKEQLDKIIGNHRGVGVPVTNPPIMAKTSKGIEFEVKMIFKEKNGSIRIGGSDGKDKERSVSIEKMDNQTLMKMLENLNKAQAFQQQTTAPSQTQNVEQRPSNNKNASQQTDTKISAKTETPNQQNSPQEAKFEYDIKQNSHNAKYFDIKLYVNGEKIGGHHLSESERKKWETRDSSITIQDLLRKYFPEEIKNTNVNNISWIGEKQAKEQRLNEQNSKYPNKEKTYEIRAENHKLISESEAMKQKGNQAFVLLQMDNKDGSKFYQTFNDDAIKIAEIVGRKTMLSGNNRYVSLNSDEFKNLQDTLGNNKLFVASYKDEQQLSRQTGAQQTAGTQQNSQNSQQSQTNHPEQQSQAGQHTQAAGMPVDVSQQQNTQATQQQQTNQPTAATGQTTQTTQGNQTTADNNIIITPNTRIEYTISPITRFNKETKQNETVQGVYEINVSADNKKIGKQTLSKDDYDLINERPSVISNVINTLFNRALHGQKVKFNQVHKPRLPYEQWRRKEMTDGLILNNAKMFKDEKNKQHVMTAKVSGYELGPKPMGHAEVNDMYDGARPLADIVEKVFQPELKKLKEQMGMKTQNTLDNKQHDTGLTPTYNSREERYDALIDLWLEAKQKNPDKNIIIELKGGMGSTGIYYQMFGEDAKEMAKVNNRKVKIMDTNKRRNMEYTSIAESQLETIMNTMRKNGLQPVVIDREGNYTNLGKQKNVAMEDIHIKNTNGVWMISGVVDGKNLRPREISQEDAEAFKKGQNTISSVLQKYYKDFFLPSQEQERKRGLSR